MNDLLKNLSQKLWFGMNPSYSDWKFRNSTNLKIKCFFIEWNETVLRKLTIDKLLSHKGWLIFNFFRNKWRRCLHEFIRRNKKANVHLIAGNFVNLTVVQILKKVIVNVDVHAILYFLWNRDRNSNVAIRALFWIFLCIYRQC